MKGVKSREKKPDRKLNYQTCIDALEILISQLNKGELAAEDQFVEVQKLLAGGDFDTLLDSISQMIYDIDYDNATLNSLELLNHLSTNTSN